uniref:alpha-L-fucosidase n=1 Tax=Ciona savignyi TaxID=51511 RepID=H2Z8L5_CIOSA
YSLMIILPTLRISNCLKLQNQSGSDWPSLDSRPLPKWFDSAKFGIFIHWGIYSVPSFYNEWFWWYWKGSKAKDSIKEFMKQNYPSVKKYTEFAQNFTAGKFVPDDWATLFRESGAKYVVFTTKHHEGFSNWPSKVHGNWNAATDGPHQDLVGAMATAVRKQNLTFGVYYSLFEWFSMNYQEDKKKNYASNEYVKHKVHPQLLELINTYKPDVLFSDGDFGPSNYWNATNFLAWLYNESPVKDTIVTNDRWGTDEVHNKHGDYFCPEHEPINTITHKWENCITLDKQSWGYRRNMVDSDVLTVNEVLTMLIRSISKGGNLLLNIGPTADGMIPQIFQQRLRKIGKWMQINGEGIYDSRPWIFHKDGANNVWYTRKGKYIYAFVLTEP